ncbi:MAG TPA: hypothetical protein VJY65_02905 [Chloroflexota bacterium]|nr:hypothetical protein [Chloroflexota bacterium]
MTREELEATIWRIQGRPFLAPELKVELILRATDEYKERALNFERERIARGTGPMAQSARRRILDVETAEYDHAHREAVG